tara:strand:+ start:2184 stop:2576 length:393 start_codon:yes stop_codon:yes gene_type:complete
MLEKINNYIFYISLVLNSILLMYLFGVVPFLLYVSLLLNAGMLWFIKNTIQNNREIERDIIRLVENIDDFEQHVEDIHSLEVYYGDQDLQDMLHHSRTLINNFIDFQGKYFDVEIKEAETEEEDAEETIE